MNKEYMYMCTCMSQPSESTEDINTKYKNTPTLRVLILLLFVVGEVQGQELGERSRMIQQLLVCPHLSNTAIGEHDNFIHFW